MISYQHLAFAGGCSAVGDDVPWIFHRLVDRRFPYAIGRVPVYVRGDGATLLDRLAESFPHSRRLLDLYHTLVKVSDRLRQAFPHWSRQQRHPIDEELSGLLRKGDGAGLIAKCQELKQHPEIGDPKALDRLENHISRHREHLWYEEVKEKGIDAGTGISEKDVDLLLDRRYELRGMSWSPKGAVNNLRIRLCLFNEALPALAAACR